MSKAKNLFLIDFMSSHSLYKYNITTSYKILASSLMSNVKKLNYTSVFAHKYVNVLPCVCECV